MHSSAEAVPGIDRALRTALLENTMSWPADTVAMLPGDSAPGTVQIERV